MMMHEDRRWGRGLFALRSGVGNCGNEWWIFSHNGQPIESWSSEATARYWVKEQDEFRRMHHQPPVQLYRCLPGVGFIKQGESE